jgi:hypothetical protein
MKQAGDIAKLTWYSVNLKLGKSLEFVFHSRPRQGDVQEGVVNQNTHERGQYFYSTTLSPTANCSGRYKPISTVSCSSHNISRPPCCQLAQVVALSSPSSNI